MKDSQSVSKQKKVTNPIKKIKQRKFKRSKTAQSAISVKKINEQKTEILPAAEPVTENQNINTQKVLRYIIAAKNLFSDTLRKYDFDLTLILIPLILFLLLSLIDVYNSNIMAQVKNEQLTQNQPVYKINPYPIINNSQAPDVTARAALVLDVESQVILYSKNPTLRFSMASTTKLMTALTALDYYKDKTILTVKTTGVQGSGIGLLYGDKLYFEDLLYAMLLPSANDAAVVIADNYPGGIPAFVKKMNEKTIELHLNNTHFSDPTGLDDDGDYTTAVDLARLASFAEKNNKIADVTSTKYTEIHTLTYGKQYSLTNLNKLLGVEGINGLKTGTTEGAGEVLVTSAKANDATYIIVILNSKNRFSDTLAILNFIKQNVTYVTPYNSFGNY